MPDRISIEPEGQSQGSGGGLPAPGGTGFVIQTAPGATVTRALAAGPGIAITNPSGVGANPSISVNGPGVTGVPAIFTGDVAGSGTLGGTIPLTLANVFVNATFQWPVSLTTDAKGRVIGLGNGEAPESVAELAHFGDGLGQGSWSPGEYCGSSTQFSTPDPSLAGGFLEPNGKSFLDLFTVAVQTNPAGADIDFEVWIEDENGSWSQAIADNTGLPIVITLPVGRLKAQNTTDYLTVQTTYRVNARLFTSFGFAPGQADITARRRRTTS